jgi:hypothetical protein
VVVFAGADKEAVYSPWANFYGNVIVIKHEDNLFTLYAHLSEIDVQHGQLFRWERRSVKWVRVAWRRAVILHFEVRRGDVEDYFATENPELWLVPNGMKMVMPFGALMISVVDEDAHLLFSEIHCPILS